MALTKTEILQLSEYDRYCYFMAKAIEQAEIAKSLNEVPIGAVVVMNNEIIGTGYNLREHTQLATKHAELMAIEQANLYLNNFRLDSCELYVTLEPCPMCSGAIVLSRLKKVIYGASDLKAGACGTLMNITQDKRLNHQSQVIKGVLEEQCQQLLRDFFKSLRKK